MPWQLDTPVSDPKGDITIVRFNSSVTDYINRALVINYDEGYMDGDEFVLVNQKQHEIKDIPEQRNMLTEEVIVEATTDFTDMALQLTPDPPVSNYEHQKGLFYDKLLEAGKIGAGTLV